MSSINLLSSLCGAPYYLISERNASSETARVMAQIPFGVEAIKAAPIGESTEV